MRWLSALGLSDFAIFPAVGEALCECADPGWGLELGLSRSFCGRQLCCSFSRGPCGALQGPPAPVVLLVINLPFPVVPFHVVTGVLIGRELQPVYAAATAGQAASAALALPPRLLELLRVVGQHLYHNVAGESGGGAPFARLLYTLGPCLDFAREAAAAKAGPCACCPGSEVSPAACHVRCLFVALVQC